jgi:hypothetical protein
MVNMTYMRARHRPPHLAGKAIAAAVLIASTTVYGATTALAEGGPSVPPGTEASAKPPVEVDGKDPDLKMADGGTLAPAKVLDIVQVVEDEGGEERREDTNADIKRGQRPHRCDRCDDQEAERHEGARLRLHRQPRFVRAR